MIDLKKKNRWKKDVISEEKRSGLAEFWDAGRSGSHSQIRPDLDCHCYLCPVYA